MIFDPLYLMFMIPGLILGLLAQLFVRASYSAQSKKDAGSGITGMQAAKIIAQKEGWNVSLQTSPGKLNDYFNPLTNTVNLSEDNIRSGSVANIAVVAHEFGHVEQKFKSSLLFKFRSAMVPAVNIGTNIGYFLIIIGVILSFFELAVLGLILFSLTTVFALITLPIEFDASRRGLRLIEKHNLIASNKRGGARQVLSAAALTYVAGFVTSILNLLYFATLVSGADD